MRATIGVKSNIPTLGMIRRRGARIGSVNRYKITASIFVGLGENQDMITLKRMAMKSTSQRILIKRSKNVTTA